MEIEEADTFTDLLWESGSAKLHALLKEARPETVLDLGCGDGLALAIIYHDYSPKRLVGVDRWTEDQILTGNGHSVRKYRTLFDSYRKNLTVRSDAEQALIQDQAQFMNVLGLQLATSAEDFLKQCREHFQLVICSNMLHYAKKSKSVQEILKGIDRVLVAEGLFFIRVIELPGKPPGWSEREDYTFDDLECFISAHLGARKGFRKVNCPLHNGQRVWTFCNF